MVFVPLVVYLVCVIVSRLIFERALKLLTKIQKEQLTNTITSFRKASTFPFIALILGVAALSYFIRLDTHTILLAMLVVVAFYVILSNTMVWSKINALAIPERAKRPIIFSRVLNTGGLVLFLALLLLQV